MFKYKNKLGRVYLKIFFKYSIVILASLFTLDRLYMIFKIFNPSTSPSSIKTHKNQSS